MKITSKFNLFFLILLVSNVAISQVRVDSYGHLGVGTTWPNTGYQCHIIKNLLISNSSGTPFNQISVNIANGTSNAEIGTANGNIHFSSAIGYNNLYAKDYFKVSDSTTKTNIANIESGLKTLQKLRPVKYNTSSNSQIDSTKTEHRTDIEFGFISQEIQKIFPNVNITKNLNNILFLDYDQIIPITVKAIQEQQIIIDSLKNELHKLKTTFTKTNAVNQNSGTFSQENLSILYQNKPNPFKDETEIQYYVSSLSFSSAYILVFDMNGSLLKKINILNAGEGKIVINQGDLKPGCYLYSLIVNEKEVESRKMILLNE